MLSQIEQYKPSTWGNSHVDREKVDEFTEEYKQIAFEVRQAGSHKDPQLIIRVQDIYSYGQFLIREQLLLSASENLYRVRRYCPLYATRDILDKIIKYNLDPRRCNLADLQFYKNINSCYNFIVVVKILTDDLNSDRLTPKYSGDYFIEYIIIC